MAVAMITSLSSRHVMIDGANNCHVRNINNFDVNHADGVIKTVADCVLLAQKGGRIECYEMIN